MRMKKQNKINICRLAGAVAAAATILLTSAASASAEGTDVFHFTDITFMSNSNGIITNADGFVGVTENTQGNAEHESLLVAVSGLETNTAYEVLARVGTNTTLTDVGTITTGRHGGASATFADFGLGKGDDQGDNEGRHKQPLPADVKPVHPGKVGLPVPFSIVRSM